jgi:hypothetical protein
MINPSTIHSKPLAAIVVNRDRRQSGWAHLMRVMKITGNAKTPSKDLTTWDQSGETL